MHKLSFKEIQLKILSAQISAILLSPRCDGNDP